MRLGSVIDLLAMSNVLGFLVSCLDHDVLMMGIFLVFFTICMVLRLGPVEL